jgi:N-acetylmuramoyl-L-alanine amidase
LVAGDGQIYEGAGWHKVGAHTRGYNTRSLGLAFIGNFTSNCLIFVLHMGILIFVFSNYHIVGQLPVQKQLKVAKDFLQCGVELGELSKNYKLFGARQVSSTSSPGLKLYRELQDWPHFTRSPPK